MARLHGWRTELGISRRCHLGRRRRLWFFRNCVADLFWSLLLVQLKCGHFFFCTSGMNAICCIYLFVSHHHFMSISCQDWNAEASAAMETSLSCQSNAWLLEGHGLKGLLHQPLTDGVAMVLTISTLFVDFLEPQNEHQPQMMSETLTSCLGP